MSTINDGAGLAQDNEIQSSSKAVLEQARPENNTADKASAERMSILEEEAPTGPNRLRSFAIMSGLCVS